MVIIIKISSKLGWTLIQRGLSECEEVGLVLGVLQWESLRGTSQQNITIFIKILKKATTPYMELSAPWKNFSTFHAFLVEKRSQKHALNVFLVLVAGWEDKALDEWPLYSI